MPGIEVQHHQTVQQPARAIEALVATGSQGGGGQPEIVSAALGPAASPGEMMFRKLLANIERTAIRAAISVGGIIHTGLEVSVGTGLSLAGQALPSTIESAAARATAGLISALGKILKGAVGR